MSVRVIGTTNRHRRAHIIELDNHFFATRIVKLQSVVFSSSCFVDKLVACRLNPISVASNRCEFNTVIVLASGNLNSKELPGIVDFAVNRETRFSKLDAFTTVETSGECNS